MILALPITWWNSFEFILSTVSPRKTSYCWCFRNPKQPPGIYVLKKTLQIMVDKQTTQSLNLVSQPPPRISEAPSTNLYHQPPKPNPPNWTNWPTVGGVKVSRCQSCNLLILFHCCNTIHLLEQRAPQPPLGVRTGNRIEGGFPPGHGWSLSPLDFSGGMNPLLFLFFCLKTFGLKYF